MSDGKAEPFRKESGTAATNHMLLSCGTDLIDS